MSYDAIVIGSGPNELVTACTLAQARQRVVVVTTQRRLGGTAAVDEIAPGFRIETCAASSGWLSPRIVKDLGLAAHGLDVESPDATTFHVAPGGPSLLLSQDLGRSREAIAKHSAADAAKWEAFAKRMAHLAGFLEALYATDPPRIMGQHTGDMVQLMGLGLKLRRLGRVDMIELLRTLPMSLADLLDDWFETDLLKASVGAGGVMNLNQGPRAQGTCFNLLHHVVGRPTGALRARTVAKGERGHLASVLLACAKQLGVEIRAEHADGPEVREILVTDDRATGVKLDSGETLQARTVVSGVDPRRTFLELVDPTVLEPEFVRAVQNVKFRGVRAFVNLALGELPKFTSAPDGDAHLRAIISPSDHLDTLERAYDDAKHGAASKVAHLEATIPSLFDPSLAPAGKHVMSIAVQFVPHTPKEGVGAGGWTDAAKGELADRVIAQLTEIAPNLRSAVLARQVTTPADLETRHGLTGGHLYQGELTLDQILFMRPIPGSAHYRTPIDGLWLTGDATHPGGNLPGLAGANAAREILKGGRDS